MPERMKPYFPSAMLLRREAQLAGILEQRRDLELRAQYLRTDSLSRDLLEERARRPG